jgi:hypothetical protein
VREGGVRWQTRRIPVPPQTMGQADVFCFLSFFLADNLPHTLSQNGGIEATQSLQSARAMFCLRCIRCVFLFLLICLETTYTNNCRGRISLPVVAVQRFSTTHSGETPEGGSGGSRSRRPFKDEEVGLAGSPFVREVLSSSSSYLCFFLVWVEEDPTFPLVKHRYISQIGYLFFENNPILGRRLHVIQNR